MARRMSRQRQELLDLLRELGPQTPATAAEVLGCSRKAAASLLYSCVDSGQVEALGDGLYGLPQDETIDAEYETIAVQDETLAAPEPATETQESPKEPAILGKSPSGLYAYSEQAGGMIPNEWLRAQKGYR
jgi:hypothetical protein